MKIVILSTYDYWSQDHLWIAKDAYQKLKDAKHTVDHISLPFNNDSLSYFEQVMAYRSLDLHLADAVVTFGPFAHVIEHRNKIVFLTGHLKNYYELWNSPYGELATEAATTMKEKISYLDKMTLAESKKVFCFYEKIKDRFENIDVDVLPLPKVFSKPTTVKKNKLSIISLGHFDSEHRFNLLIESLPFVKNTDFKLILMGKKKRVDIYDALLKKSGKWLEMGRLQLVDFDDSSTDQTIFTEANLVIDTGVAADTLPPSVLKAIELQKPIAGIQGCGLLEKSLFSGNGKFIFPEEPKELGKSIDLFLNKSTEDGLIYHNLYKAYENSDAINWEKVIS